MYRVEFLPQAINGLRRLDKPVAQRILNKLRWLAENFEAVPSETLMGPLAGLAKLRVGDYRVIYEPDRENRLITVHLVGHRREIYR
jgi:mRNA interferase RelE/StbE